MISKNTLAKLRKDAGMTQKELADMANISVGTLRSYEQGKTTPKTETALTIAEALNVDLIEVLETFPHAQTVLNYDKYQRLQSVVKNPYIYPDSFLDHLLTLLQRMDIVLASREKAPAVDSPEYEKIVNSVTQLIDSIKQGLNTEQESTWIRDKTGYTISDYDFKNQLSEKLLDSAIDFIDTFNPDFDFKTYIDNKA